MHVRPYAYEPRYSNPTTYRYVPYPYVPVQYVCTDVTHTSVRMYIGIYKKKNTHRNWAIPGDKSKLIVAAIKDFLVASWQYFYHMRYEL